MTPTSKDEKPKEPTRAQVRLGGDGSEPRHLSFRITAVYPRQKPSQEAPFHREGGEWTFLDCQAMTDPSLTFSVGLASNRRDDGSPVSWGDATLILKDREAGARFVEAFGKAFPGRIPTPSNRAFAPRPLAIKTAILGLNMDRGQEGDFSDSGGKWTATKWFPEQDGWAGEVYFNYDLQRRVGEFSEKDQDYADDLLAVFASAFRDGPRPERTPENDPNLTALGPRLGEPRRLLSQSGQPEGFTPTGRFAVYQEGSKIMALSLDQPDGSPREVIQFDHAPWMIRVLDDDLNLIVQEGIPENPGMRSSGDPMRIWWVDGLRNEKTLLLGPMKELNLDEESVAPGQRYVVYSQWQGDPRQGSRVKVFQILDRESGKSIPCESKAKDLSVVGWKKTDAGLRVVMVTDRWQFDMKKPSQLFLVDPITGKSEPQANVDPRLELDNPLSPDRKRRVRYSDEGLVVTDLENDQRSRFVFHEDDRRSLGPESVEWASPRYLKISGQRLAFIDVITMKMNFPDSEQRIVLDPHSCKFSPALRWLMCRYPAATGEGLYLVPMKLPVEP